MQKDTQQALRQRIRGDTRRLSDSNTLSRAEHAHMHVHRGLQRDHPTRGERLFGRTGDLWYHYNTRRMHVRVCTQNPPRCHPTTRASRLVRSSPHLSGVSTRMAAQAPCVKRWPPALSAAAGCASRSPRLRF
jgi:hypothetical protein